MGRPSSSFGKEVEGCKSGCLTAGSLPVGCSAYRHWATDAKRGRKPLKTSPGEGGDGRA